MKYCVCVCVCLFSCDELLIKYCGRRLEVKRLHLFELYNEDILVVCVCVCVCVCARAPLWCWGGRGGRVCFCVCLDVCLCVVCFWLCVAWWRTSDGVGGVW